MFSLVLPAYNESKNLEKCVHEVRKALKGKEYEIIIAEDGSRDGTDRIAKKLARKYRNVRHLHNDKKLGRGRALKNAFMFAKGSEMGYIDVDMATDVAHLQKLLNYSKKFDVVTGSRYISNSATERPLAREIVSRFYNFLIRIFLGSPIHDHQCGFKSFSRDFVMKEVMEIGEKSWAWDTVVLVTAVRKRYSVKEFPVIWKEKKEKRHSSSFRRIISDVKIHGIVLLKLFVRYRLGFQIRL